MPRGLVLAVLPCVLAGCLPLELIDPSAEAGSALVPSSPFGNPPVTSTPVAKVSYAPAAKELALRVDRVGREVLASNPNIGLKPLFATIGAPQPEIFHQGTSMVHVTEGLVKQCPGDAQ